MRRRAGKVTALESAETLGDEPRGTCLAGLFWHTSLQNFMSCHSRTSMLYWTGCRHWVSNITFEPVAPSVCRTFFLKSSSTPIVSVSRVIASRRHLIFPELLTDRAFPKHPHCQSINLPGSLRNGGDTQYWAVQSSHPSLSSSTAREIQLQTAMKKWHDVWVQFKVFSSGKTGNIGMTHGCVDLSARKTSNICSRQNTYDTMFVCSPVE